jgi:hypothetical protein
MPFERDYRDESRTPAREEVDRTPGPVVVEFGAPT